jgi:hypothetical protein
MISIRATLVAAALGAGAGAVIFLSTIGPRGGDTVPVGPVTPVSLPSIVVTVPAPATAAPVTQAFAPATSTIAGQATPPAAKPQVTSRRRVAPAPRRFAAQAPTTQPQPAGTDPNGSGGWQLPACYEESCVAPGSDH